MPLPATPTMPRDMEHDHHRRKKASAARTLAALMAGFTVLFTALGLACAVVAHVPLARHQVHGRDAVLLYKAVRWAGLALAGLPYVVDLLLLLFLACLWCCAPASSDRAPSRLPPPWPAQGGEVAASKEVPRWEPTGSSVSRVDWDAIRAPTFEYLVEVIRALSREEQHEGSLQDD